MDKSITDCLEKFGPISLDSLNGKAEMLERIDNKYIMPAEQLLPALEALKEIFDVLDIEGQRVFSYATRYFDDPELRGYYDHHQRRRKRVKARVRQYLDAGFSYLEVKVNEQRSMTAKRRMKIGSPLQSLDEPCMDFVRTCYRDCYGDELHKEFEPVILIEYQRITLVAKEGGEGLRGCPLGDGGRLQFGGELQPGIRRQLLRRAQYIARMPGTPARHFHDRHLLRQRLQLLRQSPRLILQHQRHPICKGPQYSCQKGHALPFRHHRAQTSGKLTRSFRQLEQTI